MEVYSDDEKLYYCNINRIRNNHKEIQKILRKKNITDSDKKLVIYMNTENQLLIDKINGDFSGDIYSTMNDYMNDFTSNTKRIDRFFDRIYNKQNNSKYIDINEIIDIYGTNDIDKNKGIKLYFANIVNRTPNKFNIVDILQKSIPLFNEEMCSAIRDILTTNVKVYLTTGKTIEVELYQFFNETVEDRTFWKIIMLHKKYHGIDYSGIDDGKPLLKELLGHFDIQKLIISNMKDRFQKEIIRIEVLDEF